MKGKKYKLTWQTVGNPTVYTMGTYDKYSDAVRAYHTKLKEFGAEQTAHKRVNEENWFYASTVGASDADWRDYIFTIKRV